MSTTLTALIAHGRWMPAERRSELADVLRVRQPPGTLLVATCHRVELYGAETAVAPLAAGSDARLVGGIDAARHLIGLAVGRESAIVGEDQVLHQLRVASRRARQYATMPPNLDRLLDLALRAGRRARRRWLPATRPTLVDVAVDRVTSGRGVKGARVHVVGTGTIGRSAVGTLLARGATVTVSSRTKETSHALAKQFGIAHTEFVPECELLSELDGVVVALAGNWPLSPAAAAALAESGAWLVDISSPPALNRDLARSLGNRSITIDDVLDPVGDSRVTTRVLTRLDALIDGTVAEYEQWLNDERQRVTAQALAIRARDAQMKELERLWQRAPTLDDTQRAEVERALTHLTERLLREPLEQLGHDSDGRHARAARELFRL